MTNLRYVVTFLRASMLVLLAASSIPTPGGGSNLADLASVTTALNASFINGSPSTFAQEHVFDGACT
jgi:hypothetical protein